MGCASTGQRGADRGQHGFSQGHVRFTLAHELGHRLLGEPRDVINGGERDMFAGNLQERRVNAFAGHLLMPEEGIRETLK